MVKNEHLENLKVFLSQHRVNKGDPFTHVTKTSPDIPSGSYYIPNGELEDFYTCYCNAVRRKCPLTVAEKPGAYGPLRVDFDFVSEIEDGSERKYSTKLLKQIIDLYQEQIKKSVDKSEFDNKMLSCIVLEKEKPRVEDGKIKDGFHLHFPHFICDSHFQDIFLTQIVTEKMIKAKIWKHLKYSGKAEKYIDQGMGRKAWMMYGSMNFKDKYSTPYIYNRWEKVPKKERWGRAYDHDLQVISMQEIFKEEMEGRTSSVEYYMPRFLSIRGYTEKTTLNDDTNRKLQTAFSSGLKRVRRRVINKKRSVDDVLKDIKTIKDGEIMEMLSEDRANEYHTWMDVGWTLFNVGEGHDETLNMWIRFSQKSAKYVPGECERLWNTMTLRDKTIASLFAMAKVDNPSLYKEWRDTNVRHYLYQSIYEPKPTEYDVAMVVSAMFTGRFCCVDAKKDVWYEFRDHRWHHMDDNIALKLTLVQDVIQQYYEFKADLARQQANDPEQRSKLEQHEKRVSGIISKLKTTTFCRHIIDMCKLQMHDAKFMTKMNENRKLICCENGVLDLDAGIFRNGRPDDYCTFSTCRYYREFNDDDDEVREFNDFIAKVFPNKRNSKYFVDAATSCLEGGNVNKRFIIATGMGDNGKSVTFKVMERAFGEYFGKFPRELLVKGRGNSSGSARPELAHVRGKRIMGVQELSHAQDIDIGVLKDLTGNDSFFTRGLYEKGGEINPMFTLWLQCNDPPKMPDHDRATWSRTRVLNCESRFVKPTDEKEFPVPDSEKKQMKMRRFKADLELMNKLEDLADVMLWILFKNYPIYKKTGLIEPEEVMKATNEYKSTNDIYMQFVGEKIEKVKKKKAKETFITMAEMYREFKEWYREEYPSYKKDDSIGKGMMKKKLIPFLGHIDQGDEDTLFGLGKSNRWWGYKIIIEDDGDDDIQKSIFNRSA